MIYQIVLVNYWEACIYYLVGQLQEALPTYAEVVSLDTPQDLWILARGGHIPREMANISLPMMEVILTTYSISTVPETSIIVVMQVRTTSF